MYVSGKLPTYPGSPNQDTALIPNSNGACSFVYVENFSTYSVLSLTFPSR